MKKRTPVTLENIANIKTNINTARQQEFKAKENRQKLEADFKSDQRAVVSSLCDDFINEINSGYHDLGYIHNNSHPFTKHVRRTKTYKHVSEKHFNAVQAFTKAKNELAKIFMAELTDNKHFRDCVIDYSSLKNLRQV